MGIGNCKDCHSNIIIRHKTKIIQTKTKTTEENRKGKTKKNNCAPCHASSVNIKNKLMIK